MKEMNREMNREMELNMDELEQVNGGMEFCIGLAGKDYDLNICGYYSMRGEEPPMNYCEMGVSLPDTCLPYCEAGISLQL